MKLLPKSAGRTFLRNRSLVSFLSIMSSVSFYKTSTAQSVSGAFTGVISYGQKDPYGLWGPVGADLSYRSFTASYSYDLADFNASGFSSIPGALYVNLTINGIIQTLASSTPSGGDNGAFIAFANTSYCNGVSISSEAQYASGPLGILGITYCANGNPNLSAPLNPSVNSGAYFSLLSPTAVGGSNNIQLSAIAYPLPVSINSGAITAPGVPVTINVDPTPFGNLPIQATLVSPPSHGTVHGFPKTLITYTPSSTYVGNDTFRIALSNANGTSPPSSVGIETISGFIPQMRYNFNNTIVSGDTTTTVAVGQPVSLTALLPQYQMATVSQDWTAGGDPIAGYTPTTASHSTGSVLQWKTALLTTPYQTSTTLFWKTPTPAGKPNVVTYKYTLSDQTSYSVSAKFSVTPAPVPIVTTHEKSAAIACNATGTNFCDVTYPLSEPGLWVSFGNTGLDPTLGYLATATPPSSGFSGLYQWVQIVNKDVIKYRFAAGGGTTCTSAIGLDRDYPVGNLPSNSADDTPGVQVVSTVVGARKLKSFTRSFSAEMYLMWTSSESGSIPVPLGSETWGFDESSQADINAPFAGWDTPAVTSSPGGFSMKSPTYPTWTTPAATGGSCVDTEGYSP